MKDFELLSPVGNKDTFYTAIRAGADAIYMGLPKFNARIKADNISTEDLPDLVRYAHLKQVKVYITLNTILTNQEIPEAIDLVGICLRANVDAFIVQDVGLITALKSVYPDIVLHGSTQMGVHNVHGARVAKSLGLSRVVLSREVTLDDIREISTSVDIELEVFIQGAMCVCFSGNCYLSSIKCNASGNRGECKQLCRLPYTLTDGKTMTQGFILSPRDNAMVDYMDKLCDIGVKSFKIEGRLRHSGYVYIATRTYREILDSIMSSKDYDRNYAIENLSRVFSRGEYIPGYFGGNDIIEKDINNHMGVNIGRVLSCTKFKDIYKITLSLNRAIHSGDGIKFKHKDSIISMGVGNMDTVGNNYVVFGKNYINAGAEVYLANDSEFEKVDTDLSKRVDISFNVFAHKGNDFEVELKCNDIVLRAKGNKCEDYKTKPTDSDTIIRQLSKVDEDIFRICGINVSTDGVFISLSQINSLRRELIAKLIDILSPSKDILLKNHIAIPKNNLPCKYDSMAIVDETTHIESLVGKFDTLILSPKVYSIATIEKFYLNFQKYFSSKLYINLPIIAMHSDVVVIDAIIDYFRNYHIGYIANNIYAFDYMDLGVEIIAGSGLNIINNFAISRYISMGASGIIGSIEKWVSRLDNTYKILGRPILMTLAHCPVKTLYGNDCSDCKYLGDMTLKSNSNEYTLRRYRIASCYWELIDSKSFDKGTNNLIVDMRGGYVQDK